MIDWNSQQMTIKKMPYHRQRQARKFIHNFLPIGKLNFTMNKKCPFCNKHEHTIDEHHYQDHFILCSKNSKKNNIIRNIQFDLDSSGIATTINETIQHCLFSLFFDTPINLNIIKKNTFRSYKNKTKSGGDILCVAGIP